MTHLCSNALLQEQERERRHDLAPRPAAPADTRQRVNAWLSDLAAGQYSAYEQALPPGRPRRHSARPAATCVTPALSAFAAMASLASAANGARETADSAVLSSTHSPPP